MRSQSKRAVGRPLKGVTKRERTSFTLLPFHIHWLQHKSRQLQISKSSLLEKIIEEAQKNAPLEEDFTRIPQISLPLDLIRNFCLKHHVKKMGLFGSVLSKDFRPDSDIDIVVEFGKDQKPSLFELVAMEKELSKIFGERKIDLKTPEELSPRFRDEVLTESEVLFAA